MAKFRRSLKFGRKHSCLGSLDGVQFTHPLAEITQRTRWDPWKVQVTLKPFRGSRTNYFKLSLPTLGSFMYPQGVQNGPFGLKQTLTGRKALYSEKSTLHGYATAWTEAYSVAKMVSCHNPVYSDESSSMKRFSTMLTICINNAQSHNQFQRLIFSFFVFFMSLSLYLRSHTYTHFFCLHLCAEIEIHKKWLQSSF